MSKEAAELQMKELDDVTVMVNLDNMKEEPEKAGNLRFADLLEYFWKKDEEEAAETAAAEL